MSFTTVVTGPGGGGLSANTTPPPATPNTTPGVIDMSGKLFGRDDKAVTANSTTTIETTSGAPIGTYALVKGGKVSHATNAHFGNTSPGSRASVDAAMFGNTTVGAFIDNIAVGVFGVDAAEAANTAKGISHAGWVLRTVGTGGRAGRVQYETLVAMGSLGAQTAAYGTPATVADASDDAILPP